MSFKTYLPRFNEAKGPIYTKRQIKERLRAILDPVDCADVTSCDFLSESRFRDTYLYQLLFSKYNDGTTSDASRLREACIQKWLQCEARCMNTNYRIANNLLKDSTIAILELARNLIKEILGPFRIEYLTDGCGWGPGASTRLTRTQGDACFKFDGVPHVTSALYPFAVAYCSDTIWQPQFEIRDYADFVTVRKNSITDRGIEPQTDMNIFFQKPLGLIIRRKMKGLPVDSTTRLDLNNQEVNRNLARLGSIDGRLATIDLSSASDLISLLLVNRLFDETWFHALNLTRVGKAKVDDTIHNLEKFSAMGNGYTWELQSLIFYAITRACYDYRGYSDTVTAVFGDDIICRSEVAPLLCETLEDLGLLVNRDKSFITGFFRESCGKHYYIGADVSPFYIRGPLTDSFEVCKLHNRLVEWQANWGYRDHRFSTFLTELRDAIAGEPFSKPIPLGYGDVGLIYCSSEISQMRDLRYRRQHVVKSRKGDYTREGHVFKCDTIVKSITTMVNEGVLIKALFCPSSEISASEIPYGNEWITGSVCVTTQWPNLGCSL